MTTLAYIASIALAWLIIGSLLAIVLGRFCNVGAYAPDDTDAARDGDIQPAPGVHGPVHFSGQYRGLPHQQQARELKADALRSGLPAAEIHDVHERSNTDGR